MAQVPNTYYDGSLCGQCPLWGLTPYGGRRRTCPFTPPIITDLNFSSVLRVEPRASCMPGKCYSRHWASPLAWSLYYYYCCCYVNPVVQTRIFYVGWVSWLFSCLSLWSVETTVLYTTSSCHLNFLQSSSLSFGYAARQQPTLDHGQRGKEQCMQFCV